MANKKTSANKPTSKTSGSAGASKATTDSSRTKTGTSTDSTKPDATPEAKTGTATGKPASRHSSTNKPAPIIEGEAKRVASKPSEPSTTKATDKPASTASAKSAATATAATAATTSAKSTATPPKVDPTKPSDTSIETDTPPKPKSSVPSSKPADKPAGKPTDDPVTKSGSASQTTGKRADPKTGPTTEPASKPVAAAPADQQTSGGSGGFGKLALAALTGAILALLGQYLLSQYLTADDQAQTVAATAELEERLTALEQAPAPQPALDEAAIDARVQEQLAAALSERADTATPADDRLLAVQTALDAAQARIDSLEEAEEDTLARLDQLDTALTDVSANQNTNEATPNGQTPIAPVLSRDFSSDIDALSGKVDDLQTTVADVQANVTDVQSNVTDVQTKLDNQLQLDPELGTKVSALQETVADNKTATESALDDLGKQLSANEEKLTGLDTRLGEVDTRLSESLNDRLAEVDTRLSELAKTNETALEAAKKAAQTANDALAATVTTLSETTNERLAAFEDRLNNGADRAAARALAAAALKRDVDLGVPFSGTLETLQSVSDTPDSVAPLAAYAQTGVPTLPALQARFNTLADDMRAALAPPPADDSLTSRLLAGARSAITVRRSGDSRDGPDGTISTIETALANGNLQAADAAWQTLPEPARAISQDWHTDLAARLTADRLVSDVVDASLRASATAIMPQQRATETGESEGQPDSEPRPAPADQPEPAESNGQTTDASPNQTQQDQTPQD